MHYLLKTVLILTTCLMLPLSTTAAEANKIGQLSCIAKHMDANKNVEVKTI
jgi:catabolite regulation protein CreA